MSSLFENQTKTPIISMYRPWANWVALGWKTIESRTHQRFRSLAGQRIGIHAGQWDKDALDVARAYLNDYQFEESMLWQNGCAGSVTCTVFVREYRRLRPEDAPAALIECQTERYGLVLESVQPILPPIAMKGYQGIWRAWLDMPEEKPIGLLT